MAPIANPTPQKGESRHIHAAPAEPSAQKSTAAPPPTPPGHPSPSNPLRAAQLRGAGLEQLNRGAIDKAIALLKEANELDPGNALIKHDLDRALRVEKALHEKH